MTRRFLSVILVLVVLLLAGIFAAGRLAPNAVSSPGCDSGSASTTAPPSQPVSAADYLAQGDYAYDQGHCAGAIAAYTQAITLDPESAEAYNNRAYTYMVQGNYASALPDLDIALQLRPDYVTALMNRGDIHNYYYAINYDQAIADYDRVLALPHDHTSVCGHRLLAQHHGWDLGVLATVVMQGGAAGCR